MPCRRPWPVARQTDPSAFVLTMRAAAELSGQSTDSRQSLDVPGDSGAIGETPPPRQVRLRARLSPDVDRARPHRLPQGMSNAPRPPARQAHGRLTPPAGLDISFFILWKQNMGRGEYPGEFEQVVLLAVARLENEAYGMSIRREIAARWLLDRALPPDTRPGIVGDLDEEFRRHVRPGRADRRRRCGWVMPRSASASARARWPGSPASRRPPSSRSRSASAPTPPSSRSCRRCCFARCRTRLQIAWSTCTSSIRPQGARPARRGASTSTGARGARGLLAARAPGEARRSDRGAAKRVAARAHLRASVRSCVRTMGVPTRTL